MKIALLGLGTVGTGVVNVLNNNKEKIVKLTGEDIIISHVLVNDLNRKRDIDLGRTVMTDDINRIYEDDSIDIVIEVMGGMDETRDIISKFLEKGIHVISANKDMLAKHIDTLAETANENDVQLLYEASVAGGIPIIHAIENTLNSNQITKVMGILNGTTNYILSKMSKDGWDYDRALSEAKEKGYAEADPTNDVEGFDAQRKIVLLSRLAYDRKVDIEEVPVTGISDVDIQDIENAGRAGMTLKLLGKSEYDESGLSVSVAPVLLPSDHQLACVNYEKNAVFVNGNAVGEAMFYGPGAGSLETASAIVSDLINCIRNKDHRHPNAAPEAAQSVKADAVGGRYYIRVSSGLADEKVQEVYNELDIRFDRIDSDRDFAVITGEISAEQFDGLNKSDVLTVEAAYQIDGVE